MGPDPAGAGRPGQPPRRWRVCVPRPAIAQMLSATYKSPMMMSPVSTATPSPTFTGADERRTDCRGGRPVGKVPSQARLRLERVKRLTIAAMLIAR